MKIQGLPLRVRRITGVYAGKIEEIGYKDEIVYLKLKTGYASGGCTAIQTANITEALYFLKSASRPPIREIKVALYSFNCMCGRQIPKGTNYVEMGGLKVCNFCGLPEHN